MPLYDGTLNRILEALPEKRSAVTFGSVLSVRWRHEGGAKGETRPENRSVFSDERPDKDVGTGPGFIHRTKSRHERQTLCRQPVGASCAALCRDHAMH